MALKGCFLLRELGQGLLVWGQATQMPLMLGVFLRGSGSGAAFLYFGRGNQSDPGVNNDQPFRNSYWNCGNRGMGTNDVHYSCLTSNLGFRVLFPRIANAHDFWK